MRPMDDLGRAVAVEAWGMALSSRAHVVRARSAAEIAGAFEAARRAGLPVGLRGAGNSYGDAAMNAGGILVETTGMDRIISWDPAEGIAVVEPGVTVEALWRTTLPDGWWPAVVPGTMRPTWGGCAAMNVHGKNHARAGALGAHIAWLEILTPSGESLRCAPDANADLFRAAVGGAGLLGAFTRIGLQLQRVRSGLVEVEARAAGSLGEAMEIIEKAIPATEHQVGWIDAFDRDGRGLVHLASPLEEDEAASLAQEVQDLPPRILGVPRGAVRHLLGAAVRAGGMRAINLGRYLAGRLRHGARYPQTLAAFHFLLDYVPEWRRAYLPGGLVQYQPFVPARVAERVFGEILDLSRRRGFVPLLAVLKRHKPDDHLLSPYVDGWSLALDYRVPRAGLAVLRPFFRTLDRIVVQAGGRFYAAKDAVLDAETFRRSLPPDRLAAFAAARRRCDPEGLLSTDLSRRLGLG